MVWRFVWEIWVVIEEFFFLFFDGSFGIEVFKGLIIVFVWLVSREVEYFFVVNFLGVEIFSLLLLLGELVWFLCLSWLLGVVVIVL